MSEPENIDFYDERDIRVLYYLLSLSDPNASNEELSNSPIVLAAIEHCGNDAVKIVVFVRISIEIMLYSNVIKQEYAIEDILFHVNKFEEWRSEQGTEIKSYIQCYNFINECLSRMHFDHAINRFKCTFPDYMQVRNNDFTEFEQQIKDSHIALIKNDMISLACSWIIMCKMLLEREMITLEELGERAEFLQNYSDDLESIKSLVSRWEMTHQKRNNRNY